MGNWEFIKRLKSSFSFLIPQSVLRTPHLAKFLIPHSALRIPHFSMGQQKILIALALFILALLYFKFYYRPPSSPEEVYKEVVIEVLGEVQKPGIYIFKNPPTLQNVIEKVGGLQEKVSFDQTSLAEILETGTQITISKKFQHPPFSKGGHEGIIQNVTQVKLARMEARKLLAFSIPIDLNRASAEDLCLVPGIGESLAQEIVTYRERRKRFRSVDELRDVRGIGEKKWKDFREFFVVRKK